MGLPIELMPYAENFYRRFPEEFIALGAPGLGEIFDLRTNGTWSRRIHETPTEKIVEITIRRWQPDWRQPMQSQLQLPPYGNGYAPPPYAGMPVYGGFAAPGDCRSSGPPAHGNYSVPPPSFETPRAYGLSASSTAQAQAPAPRPSEWQVAATGRLARLENALSLLKPSIEALLASQTKGMATPPQAPPMHMVAGVATGGPMNDLQAAGPPAPQAQSQLPPSQPDAPPALSQRRASSPTAMIPGKFVSPPTRGSDDAAQAGGLTLDGNDLRNRRGVSGLAIQTSPENMAKVAEPPVAAAPAKQPPPPVVKLEEQEQSSDKDKANDESKAAAPSERQSTKDRPKVNVVVVPQRIAPAAMDPMSPRSPGRFSAWK